MNQKPIKKPRQPSPPPGLAAEVAAADERDVIAITKFYRAILGDGFKADARRLGNVRRKK